MAYLPTQDAYAVTAPLNFEAGVRIPTRTRFQPETPSAFDKFLKNSGKAYQEQLVCNDIAGTESHR